MKRTPSSAVRAVALLFGAGLFVFGVFNTALLEPGGAQQFYIFALMACVAGTTLFVLGRVAIALALSGGLFLLLKFTAVMKVRYLESPLMPADLVYFARASLIETLVHYPHLRGLLLALCIALPLLLWLLWHYDTGIFRTLRTRSSILLRLAGTAVFAFAFWLCLQPSGPFSRIYTKALWSQLSDKAQLTNFFSTIHNSAVSFPLMADNAAAERDWASTSIDSSVSSTLHPDIVQVLEESTFDPSNFTDCVVAQCRVHMFQPDEYTRAHGLMRSHTFGGGTWAAEFAVMTGMPQDIFGPAGMYAPFVLAPRVQDTLPNLLRRLGYQTIAIYPVAGSFLNARNAYRDYGFDKFFDIKDLGLIPWHTSDAQIFAAAKRVYDREKKPGQPVFLMVLTMEQHGPHSSGSIDALPAPFNQHLMPGLPADVQLNLNTYLSRLQDSDQGMAQLEKDFLHRAQPTVLLHFGDHQPAFDNLIRRMPRTLPPALVPHKDTLTYFMLKSNFSGPALPDPPMLDIAYLPSMLLRAAALPEDPYFSALTTLEARCDGSYTDCQNKPLLLSYYAWIFGRLHVLK
jgi:phosphoglycerol transferase MdoB-like AlkP superfamily enzyme